MVHAIYRGAQKPIASCFVLLRSRKSSSYCFPATAAPFPPPLFHSFSVSASPLMYAEKNFFGTAERKGVSRYCIAIDSANKTSRLLGYALGTRTKATSLRVSVFISQSQSPTRTRWRPNTCLSDIIGLQIAFGNLSLCFVG